MKLSSLKPLSVLCLPLLAFACSSGGAQECGEGTREQFGLCVVDVAPEVRCGEGTTLNESTNRCEALIVCGDGTAPNEESGLCEPLAECASDTFLNLETGECVPSAECGEGTVGDAELRECVSVVECGPGTFLDAAANVCLALEPCAEGATLNPQSGECEASQTCGEGFIVVQGVCTEPERAILLEVDVIESAPDRNDPEFGGTPEAVTLEAMGEKLVLQGTIERPADATGDGDLVQDKDLWRFDGRAGDLLEVTIISLGLPQPAFVVEGPKGYKRSSSVGYDSSPSRLLMLPYDGRYELTVAPSSFLLNNQPLGNQDAEYALSIERRPLPARLALSPGTAFDSATQTSGALLNAEQNFIGIDAPSGTPVFVGISGEFEGTKPALMAFNRNLELINSVQELDEQKGFMGVNIRNDAFVFVDWSESLTPSGDYELSLYTPPLIERGDVPADFNTVTQRHESVPGLSAAAYRFTLEEEQVIKGQIAGQGVFRVDVQVVGPQGGAVFEDNSGFFFLADAGDYTLFAFNDGANDDDDVSLTIQTLTPNDFGTLESGIAESARADLLTRAFGGYTDTWFVVEAAEDTLTEFSLTAEAGDAELSVFDTSGQLLRAMNHAHLGQPIHVRNKQNQTLLVRVDPDDRNLVKWEFNASQKSLPIFVDEEPNDTRQSARDLGFPPLEGQGVMARSERDVYRVRLPAPLDEDQALEIRFDNIQSDSLSSGFTDAVVVNVYDAAFVGIPTIPQDQRVPGLSGSNTLTVAPSFDVGTEIYIEFFGNNIRTPAIQEYVFSVEVTERAVEIEPNDTFVDADDLTVGDLVYAYRGSDDEADLFRLTLESDLGADESLRVIARNLETQNNLEIVFYNDAEQEIARSLRLYPQLNVGALVAGTYYVGIENGNGGLPLYDLRVVRDQRVEAEPNDLVAENLGVLTRGASLEVMGSANSIDSDLFTFELDPPLGASESLDVACINLDDGSNLSVAVHANAQTLSRDLGVSTRNLDGLRAEGPFVVEVKGTLSQSDRYRLSLSRGTKAEAEPNGDPQSANLLHFNEEHQVTMGSEDTDVFVFDVAAGETNFPISVLMSNLSDGTSIDVSVFEDDFETLLGGGLGFRVRQNLFLDAGRYYVVLQSRSTVEGDSDHVRLEVIER